MKKFAKLMLASGVTVALGAGAVVSYFTVQSQE